jgi:16S rRNA (cytosine1402-N4)-methyltransferase
MSHIPVLLDEVLAALLPPGRTIQRVIDGTPGAAGHSRALLEHGAEQLLAIELDPFALELARQNLRDTADRVHLIHDSYVTMAQRAAALGWDSADAILLDLGLSSMQLDTPERGFAFKHDAPLDMRFNPDADNLTAADIINQWSPESLTDIFWRYGEEQFSRQIVRAIMQQRPISTTRQLAELIYQTVPRKKEKNTIHPATRIFQALRIAVNNELESVETVLPIAINLLKPGGRLAVITFHSLEDRIVKQHFKDASTEIIAPPGMASLPEKKALVNLITRKPIEPSEREIAHNPRSRSAKLRVVEKR